MWASVALADTVNVATVDDLKSAIAGAVQGDEIIIAAGTYALTQPLEVVGHGTVAAPIVIHGADGATAIIQQGSIGDDVFTIQDTSYIELRNLTMTGGLRGVHIIASDNITVANNVIHDVGQSGFAAIDSASAHNYQGITITSNDIYNFGTALANQAGIYLGCIASGCTVTGPVVASNYIHDTASAPVGQGDGILMQPGVAASGVRDNIVVGVNGRGIAALDAGAGGPNTVERNGIWSTTDVGIDVSGGATIRNNIIIDTNTAGIHAAPAPGSVMNLSIINNSVLVTGSAIAMTSPQNAVVIADNALYGATALSIATPATAPTVVANIGSGDVVGADSGVTTGSTPAQSFVNAKADATALNVFPKSTGPLIGAGDATTQAADDFNGTVRGTSLEVGAYVFSTDGNTGWPLAARFKSLEPAGGDSGLTGDDNGPADPNGGGSTIGGGGASLPVGGGSGSSGGCTAVAGSWAVSLLVAIGMLGKRRKDSAKR